MLTVEQAKQYLASVGVVLPDFLLEALVEQVNTVEACLVEHGATPSQITLVLLYLIGLMGVAQGDRYVTSQRAPNGAARSFKFQSVGDRWRGLYGMLKGVDLWGCTDALIPPNPADAGKAGLWVARGGCCE